MKYARLPKIVEAVTYDDLVEIHKNTNRNPGDNPNLFHFMGLPIEKHIENFAVVTKKYVVFICKSDILVVSQDGTACGMNTDYFLETFAPCNVKTSFSDLVFPEILCPKCGSTILYNKDDPMSCPACGVQFKRLILSRVPTTNIARTTAVIDA